MSGAELERGNSRVAVLGSSPSTPELCLRSALSEVDDVEGVVIYLKKKSGVITYRVSLNVDWDVLALMGAVLVDDAVRSSRETHQENLANGDYTEPTG